MAGLRRLLAMGAFHCLGAGWSPWRSLDIPGTHFPLSLMQLLILHLAGYLSPSPGCSHHSPMALWYLSYPGQLSSGHWLHYERGITNRHISFGLPQHWIKSKCSGLWTFWIFTSSSKMRWLESPTHCINLKALDIFLAERNLNSTYFREMMSVWKRCLSGTNASYSPLFFILHLKIFYNVSQ